MSNNVPFWLAKIFKTKLKNIYIDISDYPGHTVRATARFDAGPRRFVAKIAHEYVYSVYYVGNYYLQIFILRTFEISIKTIKNIFFYIKTEELLLMGNFLG